jgi:hypothetical protein
MAKEKAFDREYAKWLKARGLHAPKSVPKPKEKAGGGLISDENLSKYMEQGSGALPRGNAALLKKMYKGELDKYMKKNDGGMAYKTRRY